MDAFPRNLIEQYLKTSNRLKKFERIVFKRFAPNVSEVQNEFARLAVRFEEAGIYAYAAMCHLGVAKCEMSAGNLVNECNAYLKAARAFVTAHSQLAALHLRSQRGEYQDGALRCYTHALARCPDDSVLKAAIIREMTPLQPHYAGTSTFVSPAHCIYEQELAAHRAIEQQDFLYALQQLDDIVDNIYERKRQHLYVDVLCRVEILRLLLLVALQLPPSRQSPSHIKLIEYYYNLANFEQAADGGSGTSDAGAGGDAAPFWNTCRSTYYIPQQMQFVLAEIILAWQEQKYRDLKLILEQFLGEFTQLNAAQRFVVQHICANADKYS